MSVVHEHVPVLAEEVVELFSFPGPALVIDGTLGLGGHSERLLERYPGMKVLGLEWDTEALDHATTRLARFGERFEGVAASYAQFPSVLSQRGRETADGILLDLGLSSMQLQDSDRGFSFLRPGPLDMRMSQSLTQTAWQVLTHSSEEELARLFREYGEEPQARKIARALTQAIRNHTLSNDAWKVAELIRKTTSTPLQRMDPATRCFQALRIAVNGELANLQSALDGLEQHLAPGGRAAVISFHSLEDRRVKTAFQAAVKGCVCPPRFPQCVCHRKPWGRLLQRKPVRPSETEVQTNPRSRSAKLRALEHL